MYALRYEIFQDPIMNPDLVKKVPSERQGQILQQLTELRKVSRVSAVSSVYVWRTRLNYCILRVFISVETKSGNYQDIACVR